MTNAEAIIALKRLEIINQARECLISIFYSWINLPTTYWFDIPRTIQKCGKIIRASIPLIEAGPENYERKYYMLPQLQYITEPCSVVTFGNGGEIVAEKHIQMSFPHCTFMGFDPNPDYEKLFVKDLGGKFVETAVGGKSGNKTIFQLQKSGYAKAPETQILSAAELIEVYHGKNKIIDILNIDIEGSEYSIFEEMLKDKIYENICQINVEIHPIWYHDSGYSYSEVIKLIKNLMENGTFFWIKTFVHRFQFFPSNFINIKNKKRMEKYLKNRLY